MTGEPVAPDLARPDRLHSYQPSSLEGFRHLPVLLLTPKNWVHPNLHPNGPWNLRGLTGSDPGTSGLKARNGPEILGFGPVLRPPFNP